MIVYKTTNLVNGKIYIGQDSKNNPNYLGSGYIFLKAFNKYGKENFKKEILEHCQTKEELNDKEIYWIEKLNSTNSKVGYNIATGGQGGNLGPIIAEKKSKTMKKFIKENPDFLKGENNPNYNSTIYKFYNIRTEEIFEGTLYEIAIKIGSKSSAFKTLVELRRKKHKDWILYFNKEIYTNEMFKENRIKNSYNYDATLYTFKNIHTNIIEKITQNEFRKKYNLSHSQLSNVCSGKRKTIKGWILI